MYKCGKSVTCNFGEVFFNERTYSVQRCEDFRETLWDSLVEGKEKRTQEKIGTAYCWLIIYLRALIMRYYSDVHLAETKNRRTRELHQSGTFKREREKVKTWEKKMRKKDKESVKFELSYVHNEFQNVMVRSIVSVYCLSRYIPRC